MTLRFSVPVRNAELDSVETTIGTAALLQMFTGAQEGNCAANTVGTLLANLQLPSDYFSNAANGSKAKLGSWSANASANGNVGHFRMFDSTGNVCHAEGNVTLTGGGGDMTVDSIVFTSGQTFSVTGFTYNAGNP